MQRKQGKGKGKYFEEIQKIRNDQVSDSRFPYAHPKGSDVLAQMRDGQTYKVAEILEVRKARNPNEDEFVFYQPNFQEKEENQANDSNPERVNLEYYVSYLGIDRRNDRWLQEALIYIDGDEIEKQREEYEQEKLTKKQNENFLPNNEHEGMNDRTVLEFLESTKIKTVEFIVIGKHQVEAWYFTPLPKEYHCHTLYICEYCLLFYTHKAELERHSKKCKIRHPPGDEIYRDDKVAMFEVDGRTQQVYCENLCYIAKIFLDHKTLFYEIEPFHFYTLCEYDDYGYHFVGYFSKEKYSPGNNLSCIMVMPFNQRSGYGKFLIEFSYELSLKEQKTGTPERPLSDLGHRTYVSWWTHRIVDILLEMDSSSSLSIQDISTLTAIDQKDITYVLENFDILRYYQGSYYLYCEPNMLREVKKTQGHKGRPVLRENVHWVPHNFKNEKPT